ncbi:MAG: acetylxylan esterase [Lentisphaerae bacterium]|nr:acetylxylan esterase [Lentisphaerota bacterium]
MRSREEMLQAVNYDESKVPQYVIPSPLQKADGSTVRDAAEWVNFQRPRILELFRREVYGASLPRPDSCSFQLLSCKSDAYMGLATRKEIRLRFEMADGKTHSAEMLLYLPNQATAPVPVFLGLCFKGNHVTSSEKDVRITGQNYPGNQDLGEDKRGLQAERWQFPEVLKRGYAAATLCYHDFFPDHVDGWQRSALSLFYAQPDSPEVRAKHTAIGVWAWGLSRALDCLEAEPGIDARRVAVHGHSRLGKTALWAGAQDPRFRLVISNDSGCCGAALSKRYFGENLEVIVNVFPHWFVTSFAQYARREAELPFDQNFLISLQAPRAVCIASASEDLWADPRGEFLSGAYAGEVYRLFGADSYSPTQMPAPGGRLSGLVSYHLRAGKHDQTGEDWQHYLELADRFLK